MAKVARNLTDAASGFLKEAPSALSGRSSPSACVTSCRLVSGTSDSSSGNTSSTITTSAITKASTTPSLCLSGRQTRERSDATNASAESWATTGGRPHSGIDRDFGQDGAQGKEPNVGIVLMTDDTVIDGFSENACYTTYTPEISLEVKSWG